MKQDDYQEIGWAELKVDVYGGPDCDQHIKKWNAFFEGDMEDDTSESPIILNCEHFPPGTKVVIKVPVCPMCEIQRELCECGFDWHNWDEERYS